MTSRRRMMMAAGKVAKTKGVINGIIQDSLEQIIINCQKDKAKDFYSVGDRMVVPMTGFGDVEFDYLGSGLETRSDGTNKPVSSWLARNVISTCIWFEDNYTSGGWPNSDVRRYCRTTLYQALPKIIRNNIVEVNLISNAFKSDDNVWIISRDDIRPKEGQNSWLYEQRFPTTNSLKKTGVKTDWWTRTHFDDLRNIYMIGAMGEFQTLVCANISGVVPGFCL